MCDTLQIYSTARDPTSIWGNFFFFTWGRIISSSVDWTQGTLTIALIEFLECTCQVINHIYVIFTCAQLNLIIVISRYDKSHVIYVIVLVYLRKHKLINYTNLHKHNKCNMTYIWQWNEVYLEINRLLPIYLYFKR